MLSWIFASSAHLPRKRDCHGKSGPVRGSVTPLPVPIYRGLRPINLQLTRASKTAIPLRDRDTTRSPIDLLFSLLRDIIARALHMHRQNSNATLTKSSQLVHRAIVLMVFKAGYSNVSKSRIMPRNAHFRAYYYYLYQPVTWQG
jgi:hypothetical protein